MDSWVIWMFWYLFIDTGPNRGESVRHLQIPWMWQWWGWGVQRAGQRVEGQSHQRSWSILLNHNMHFSKDPFYIILQAAIPFAVVGSNTVVEVAGKKVRGRMYQWGIVEGWCCNIFNTRELRDYFSVLDSEVLTKLCYFYSGESSTLWFCEASSNADKVSTFTGTEAAMSGITQSCPYCWL